MTDTAKKLQEALAEQAAAMAKSREAGSSEDVIVAERELSAANDEVLAAQQAHDASQTQA